MAGRQRLSRRSAHYYVAVLQLLQRRAWEFRQLVEEEHTLVGQRDLALPGGWSGAVPLRHPYRRGDMHGAEDSDQQRGANSPEA